MNYSSLESNSTVDYKKMIKRLLSFKRLYILFGIIFLLIAFLYNRSASPTYANKTSILISEKDKSVFGGSGEMFDGMGFLSGANNIDNEIEVLQSFSLVRTAIQNLDFKATIKSYEKSFYAEWLKSTGFIKQREFYKYSPLNIEIDQTKDQATYLNFNISFIDENTFQIEAKGDDIYLYNYIEEEITDMVPSVYFKNTYTFGEQISTKYFSFSINKTDNYDPSYTENNVLYFYLNNTNSLALEYVGRISAEPVTQLASIINLSCSGPNFYKISDFLNSLSAVFLDRNLQKKNNTASSTVSFIDAQISDFADSLSTAEATLEDFRASHQVMDLSFQGQQIIEKLNDLESDRANLQIQKRYYSYLREYFQTHNTVTDLLAPASMNVNDPILTPLVNNLIEASNERVSISQNDINSDHILLKDLDLRINNLKRTIIENASSSLSTINNNINEIDYRINKLRGQVSNIPKTELQLQGIERKFELNNEIYTFLLKKRSEAQIAKASSMPDYEVIEPARTIKINQIGPRSKLNYLIALFLAFLLPTAYILAIDFFNNTIMAIDEVEKLTNRPILGKVFHNFRKINLIVAQRPNSSVAESFRNIRTNFEFFNDGGKKQVILITSSASGDGKSFCSINLATVLALNGYRTALLEFDLRRPKVHQEFGSSNMIGITSYLIEKAIIDDIIMPTEVQNLDLISAGPAAPNPAELIASEKTADFIDTLKEMYDYIVIDSAPVGVVSESYMLMKHSDMNIFVTRLGHTNKDAFKTALKGLANNKFDDYNILINDVNIKRDAAKHGYDNKYYTEDTRGFLAKMLSRK